LDSLHYTDHQLGRLFAALERDGQLERSVVVVTGDTGQAFMEHGFATHANRLFQEVLHTPLILHVPGGVPAVLDLPSSHVDIPATIFGRLGLPPHPSFQGLDLLDPAFPAVRSRYAVAQSPLARELAIVHGRYKLRRGLDAPPDLFLYDLVADPGETRDLATERPDIADALRLRLDTWASRQFEYYRDSRLQRATFPPRLEDPPIPGTFP